MLALKVYILIIFNFYKRERPEPYYAISLDVKNKSNINESLSALI